jgi:cytochrome P450
MVVSDVRLSDPDFWSAGLRDEGFAMLRRERPVAWQEEPACEWNPQGGRGYWALTRLEDVRAVSRDTARFGSGMGTEIPDLPPDVVRTFGAMLNMDDPEHRRLRAIVSKPFTPPYLAELRDLSREHAVRLLDAVAPRGGCDLMGEVLGVYPAQVICHMMGVPEEDRAEMTRLTGVALGSTYGLGDSYDAMLELIELAAALSAAKRAEPQHDLLSKIAHAEVDGDRLTDHEAGAFAALLLTAGIETTGTALAQGVIALQRQPDELARWRADFDALAATAVEDVVRWSAPVMQFRRTALADVELAGQRIATGDKVVLWYYAANRDERAFERPERIDVGRSPNRHVAFGGGGPHFCLGANLARMEMTVMFEELFRRLPDLRLDGEPELLHSNFINGVVSLPVAYTPA